MGIKSYVAVYIALILSYTIGVVSIGGSDFHGFYQADMKFTPDNETDHLRVIEDLNRHARSMLAALEFQTKQQVNKLSLEAITLGQTVLHSAELRFRKYAHPEGFVQYLDPRDITKFYEAHKDTRFCLEKIDSIFQTLPGPLMK